MNMLPMPTLWSIMFFFMLVTVGIDTEFGMLEGVVTPIMDMKIFPNLRKEVLSGMFKARKKFDPFLMLHVLGG
jgi:solute carrier family 6 amino acid/orphan transporter-like 15/16/17/18/20